MSQGIKTQKTLSKVWILFLILSIGGWSIVIFINPPASLKKDKIFDPGQYQGATGSIILPYRGESLLELKDLATQQPIRLSTHNGFFSVPSGEFLLVSYTVITKETYGTEQASLAYLGSPGPRISVASGSTKQLEIGPPCNASIIIQDNEQDKVKLAFELTDRGGNPVMIVNTTPGFQVINHSGDILWQSLFKYG